WDVVFCRNVLRYFVEDRADEVIARLACALAPGGYLFLGHAESLRDRTDDFVLCHTHGAFYYQRAARAGDGRAVPGLRDRSMPSPVVLDTQWYDDIHAATQRVHAMVDDALDPAL